MGAPPPPEGGRAAPRQLQGRAASATFSTDFITIATAAAFANDLVALALRGHVLVLASSSRREGTLAGAVGGRGEGSVGHQGGGC